MRDSDDQVGAGQVADIKETVLNLSTALKRDLGIVGLIALTRLQMSPFHVTYRGAELNQVLFFADPRGKWSGSG